MQDCVERGLEGTYRARGNGLLKGSLWRLRGGLRLFGCMVSICYKNICQRAMRSAAQVYSKELLDRYLSAQDVSLDSGSWNGLYKLYIRFPNAKNIILAVCLRYFLWWVRSRLRSSMLAGIWRGVPRCPVEVGRLSARTRIDEAISWREAAWWALGVLCVYL